jgi:tryptophanyl-tRNA synthetase
MRKDIVLSAITTSGNITLGNYIGAVTNWKEMLSNYDSYFMVANLHSITTYQDPKLLKARTESFYALYVAMGLDPKKCTLFVQSQVPEHAELQWVLSCVTPLGNLNRMTQFKDKSATQKSILSGLLMYPVLMAADILLYQAKYVPVGEDQKQHLELCRDIVTYFENTYGQVFQMPEAMIPKLGARIMSLVDPDKKMSKSDANPDNYITVLDDPKLIEKKIKRATTDSGTVITYNPESKGIANLMTIYSNLTGKSFDQIEKEFDGKMYGHFKIAVAEAVIETFKPIQAEYKRLIDNKDFLYENMKMGSDKARESASKTLKNVYESVGMLS